MKHSIARKLLTSLLCVLLAAALARGTLGCSKAPESTGSGVVTMEEMEHIAKTVPEVVAYLRNMSPVWRDLQTGKRQYIL